MNELTKIWIYTVYTKIWINNLNMNELNKDLSEQWLP